MVIIIICFLFFILLVAFLSRVFFIKKVIAIDLLDIAPDTDQDYMNGYFKSINMESSGRYCILPYKLE